MPTSKKSTPAKSDKSKKKLKKKNLKTSETKTAGEERVLSSKVVYEGKLFRVTHDHIVTPTGLETTRDVVRHSGSVIILALDTSRSKKDPWIVMERQYRHAAGRFLWELPAGRLDPGEEPLTGAQRELEEETGYRAKKWKPLVEYYASPGFLGESMKVFTAEGLVPGDAHPEADENIELRLIKLSDILKQIEKGNIMDGKTLSCILLYNHLRRSKRK